MSWALTACVLIRVHARPAQWVPVEELASHLAVDVPTLRAEAQAMFENAQLQVRCQAPGGQITHVCAVVPARGAAA